MPDITASIANAPQGCLGEMFRCRGQRHGDRHWPLRRLESRHGYVLRRGPRDVVDREPWRDCNGRGRYPGERHDIPVEMGLVGLAALRRYEGGALPRRQAVCRVVETDQPCGVLGGEADLGPEP